ncbi:MAG TPA: MBL fold metallo-hydrolase, partial [Armatimonadota bacterium]|nr:MBL fold metallo-hydrolase [Armatimonadota bacterium]
KLIDIVINGWEPSPAALPQENALIQTIFVPYGSFGENCYILTCQQTSKSAVIDPGGAANEIVHAINESNLSLDLILLTHAHGDHTAGIPELASNFCEFRVVSHPADKSKIPLIDRLQWQGASDDDQLKLGNLDILVQYTPGHTPGALCYQVDQVCFVGDTLFAGSIGRPASSDIYEKMLSGIRNKILSLPRDTIILPGHGPITTVGEEISHNPFF